MIGDIREALKSTEEVSALLIQHGAMGGAEYDLSIKDQEKLDRLLSEAFSALDDAHDIIMESSR